MNILGRLSWCCMYTDRVRRLLYERELRQRIGWRNKTHPSLIMEVLCSQVLLLLFQKTLGCGRWKRAVHQRRSSSSQEVQRQDQLWRLQLLVAPTFWAVSVFFFFSQAKLISSYFSFCIVFIPNDKLKLLFFKDCVMISFYTSSFKDKILVLIWRQYFDTALVRWSSSINIRALRGS